MTPKSDQMAPLGAQGGAWGGHGTPKTSPCRFGGHVGVKNGFKMSKNDPPMALKSQKKNSKYFQNEVYIHRNSPLESPGGILVCLANIFASVPLSIQKPKRHAARFCLPCLHSPSSLSSCAGCVCVRLCQRNATKYFKRLLCFLGKHLRIRASTHPDIHTASAGDAKRKQFNARF